MVKKFVHKAKSAASDKFIVQSIRTMMLRVLGVIVLFGFTFFITNNYPARIVGQYDFVRSFLLIVGSLCLLGTDQSVLYYSGRLRSSNSIHELMSVYKKMLAIILLASFAVFLIVVMAETPINAFFDDPEVYPIIFKCSAVLFFNGLTLLNTEVFRAMGFNYLSEMFRNIIKYVPVITGAILLLIIHQENYLVDFYIFGFVMLGVITTGMVFYYLNRIEHGEQTPRISVKEIVVTSYPIAMSGMAVFLLMGIDIMLLKKYQSSEVVAYYGVAVKLMTMLSVIVVTVNVTLSTKIAELFTTGDHDALRQKVKSGSKLIFLLTSPAAAVICIFPETILSLFGEQYESARDALIILTLSQWICSYFGVVTVYLNMTRKQHIFQYILIVAVIINFIMNSLLIPEYGMTGAAISFAVSILFWNIVSAGVIYRTDKINLFWR